MQQQWIAWGALGLYALVTAYLAYRGWRKTKSLESFTVGARDVSPLLVGLSLAAQLTSVATFVVNPGLVYAYGLSGLLGLGVAAALGITLGIVIFTRAFRRVGEQVTALSVPQWIGSRYKSKLLSGSFGFISLALVSYAVLIVVAISHVLAALLGLPAWMMAAGLILFVFTYVALGGVNAHIQTNAMQALIMVVVALILVGAGLPLLWEGDGLFARIAAIDSSLVGVTNPSSPYFRNLFEVFVCNFLVGLALVCQPHILSKSLYLKQDSDVRRYLGVAIVVGVVFMSVMLVGLFARVQLDGAVAIDHVVPAYIASNFSYGVRVIISIGLLCAGISTLEGILLALSTVISVDLFMGLFKSGGAATPELARKRAFLVGRLSIVVLGVLTFLLSRWQIVNPTGGSVAIFAQYGVYGLTTASIVPLASGMFIASARRLAVTAGTFASLGTYFFLAISGIFTMSNNPAFLATGGIVAGWIVFAIVQLATKPEESEAGKSSEEAPKEGPAVERDQTASVTASAQPL